MKSLVDNPKNIFEVQVNEVLQRKISDEELLLSIASMVFFSNPRNESLTKLYNNVGLGPFVQVMDTFSGKTITFPTKQELEELLTLSMCFYFREIEEKEWDEIQSIIPFELNTVLLGHKIGGINKMIKNHLSKKSSSGRYSPTPDFSQAYETFREVFSK